MISSSFRLKFVTIRRDDIPPCSWGLFEVNMRISYVSSRKRIKCQIYPNKFPTSIRQFVEGTCHLNINPDLCVMRISRNSTNCMSTNAVRTKKYFSYSLVSFQFKRRVVRAAIFKTSDNVVGSYIVHIFI